MTKKNALGKGLGALIADVPQNTEKISVANYEIDISKIVANPGQPRTSFDEDSLTELADSIKIHGIIQPLTLREINEDEYQIISGERRFRAAKMVGLTTVPAFVRTANDHETLEMALIENIQREDLDAMEIALSYNRLIDECQLTQEELSARVGKKRATVTNYLRLLTLEDEVQQSIKERKISMGHARTLAGITDKKIQRKLANKIVSEDLSVRQIEDIVKKMNEEKLSKPTGKQEELSDRFCLLVELLESKFNSKIHIKRNRKGEGSIIINYASDDDIETFIKNLSV